MMLRLISALCLCFTFTLNLHTVAADDDEGDLNPQFMEGDIEMPKRKIFRNAPAKKSDLWSGGVIPYEFARNVRNTMKDTVEAAVREFSQKTCIKWVARKNQPDYVRITSDTGGCHARVGRRGGSQGLNLADPQCKVTGQAIHEMMHAVGFVHEQSRTDRDEYVTINWDNIPKRYHHQFKKSNPREEDLMGFPYDQGSVMHYPEWAFGRSKGLITITSKDTSKQKLLGNREGFSAQDVEEVNKLYNCKPADIGKGPMPGNPQSDCKDIHNERTCEHFMKQFGKSICDPKSSSLGAKCKRSCGLC